MNRSKSVRFLALFLAVVMVIGYVPVSAFATETTDETAAPETVTVSFDVNGGVGEYEDQVVTIGEKVAEPEEDPTYESYEFAYWTADLEENIAWDFEEDVVAEDMTLYAAWTSVEEEVTKPVVEETEAATEPVVEETEAATEPVVEETEAATEPVVEETEAATEPVVEETDDNTVEPVKYTVQYYRYNWETDANDLFETEELTGIPGQMTAVQEKEYEGLILMEEIIQVEIAADGSTVVCVYYTEQLEEAALYDSGVIYEDGKFGYNGYYNVISRKDYVLVPGAAVEYEMVLNNAAGNRRQVIHVIEVDPSNPDVSIVPGYHQIDKIAEDPNNEAYWSHKELTEMAKYYENQLGYNIVGGMNTDLYYSSYSPRVLVYNGKWIGNAGENVATGGTALGYTSSILYVFKDAEGNVSCDVKAFNKADVDKYLADGTLLHAVGVSFGMVVNDGKLVSTTEKRGNDDAARSMVGVKPDGTLVICMNDGRGANNSVGFSSFEEGEAMLALGCQWAANCDGGGSSTFLSKRVGEDTFTMRSVPCDGAQRPTAHGIFVASNVAPTGELNNVNIESEYDIFAPNTVYTFGAEAIDTHGYAMDMPADASWGLSDDSFGTIVDGKFASNGTKGTVDVQVLSGSEVVGSKTITVADPAVFKLSATSTVMPYTTADKVRTIALPIVAMIGEANVYIDTNAVSVALSNAAAGTLDGFNFTATSDTSIAGVDVTVTYGETKLVYAIEFGKGSEIIYDFEDGDEAGFMGFEAAKEWSLDNGVNNTLVGSDPLAGQMNAQSNSLTFTTTAADGGQVRNGKYALAWKLDNTDADFANWTYNVLFNTGDTIVLRDVANDMKATTLGMWLYVPVGAPGLAFQSQLYVKNADGSYSCKQDHFMFTSAASGKQTNLNSATEADIPESRWVYASIDISKYDYLCTPVATDEGNSRSPSFLRTYVKPTAPAELTFYIDDITLDYSSAVDDRVLPAITNPTYSTSDTAVSLENGKVIDGTKIAFSATVTDNAALDLSSGKIYVDGMAVKAAIAGSVLSSKEDVVLVPGAHTVAFEVKDELGNPAKLTRNFTVAGDAVVTLTGHNDSGEAPKAQSVYYVDINVADLTKVDNLVAELKLNNANTWETEGAVVAAGFKANFEYNEVSELLTVTVENVSAANAADNTLVSIPVRGWTYDRYDYVNEVYETVASMGNKPVVDIICNVVYGSVDGTPFGGSIKVATELTTISSPYHEHDAALTVLNKEASCAENGYENRTYCETCKSVVEWGTITAAAGHNYVVSGDELVCDKDGVTVGGNGLVTIGEKIYCLIGGKLVTGWQNVDGEYVYVNATTKEVQVGTVTVSGITYTTDKNGFVNDVWVTDAKGTKCSYGPKFYTRQWVELEGEKYYFGTDSYAYIGIRRIPVNRNNTKEGYTWHEFAEDGKLIHNFENYDGIVVSEVDGMHYVKDGMSYYAGLVYVDTDNDGKADAYYYARTSGEVVCGKSYWVTKNNDLLPVATYEFDADGKMLNPPVVEEPEPDQPEAKNGVCADENGKLWYYVNDVKTYGGLLLIDGAYYYARTSGEIVVNRSYYISKNNDLLPVASYSFGADGKMLNSPVVEPEQPDTPVVPEPPVEPEKKNGIISEGGKMWWYVDDVKTYGGLMLIDGAYYYARTSGEIVTNRSYYITKNNDLLPVTSYTFDAEGKMVNPPVVEPEQPDVPVQPEQPEVKNGIVSEDGKLWWYVDGVKTYGGLMLIDGDYYYARTSGEILTSRTYWISKTNDLLPAANYTFGVDGKMVR